MTDIATVDTSLREAFAQERGNRVDRVMEEAQRLVNLYHHVDLLGKTFGTQFDEMLMSISPEVQTALQNILGGAVVRQYYEFLKNNKKEKVDTVAETEEKSSVPQTGYLPSPAADEPIMSGQMVGESGHNDMNMAAVEAMFKNLTQSHQEELERLLKAQIETLSQVMQRLDQNTHEVASHQTDRLINAIKQETGKRKEYSDVIESTPQKPVSFTDETEGP